MQRIFGQNVAKLSKKMVKEDKEKQDSHRAMIRANQAANVELANQKYMMLHQNSESNLHEDNLLNARKLEVESKL